MAALGQVDNRRDIQISAQRAELLAHLIRFIRLRAEQAVCILFGIHGHRAQVQVGTGAKHADCNFAAVGNQNLVDRVLCHGYRLPFYDKFSSIFMADGQEPTRAVPV